MARRTLAQRRRTAGTPEMDDLEQVLVWLESNKRLHQLRPDGDHHTYLHRRTVHHPWAEVGTYPSVIAFGVANAIVPPRRTP